MLLAILLVNANRIVSADYVISELWGGSAPKGAVNQLHGYVMRLRRQLEYVESVSLETRAPGYQLIVSESGTDIAVFTDRVDRAREAHRAGDLDLASELIGQALVLWRGPAYADVPGTMAVSIAADRLEEQRLIALELSAEIDLDRGLPDKVVSPMGALVAGRQIRERAWFCFMLALYRCGRSTDALDAYQTLYERLTGELGLEPSASIRALHSRILRHDSELDTMVCASAWGATETVSSVPPNLPQGDRATGPDILVPRQLPVDVWRFTGRVDRLAEIETLAANGDGRITAVIDGMPGVGKTALAVHTAHRLAERFPDGQLYVNLRGHSAREHAEDPADVLEKMLLALGTSGHLIPPGLAERAALYRSRLAGTRTLIVLDNAATESQVRPLLPAAPGCFAVVTSRRRLGGLDEARHISLDVLTGAEASLLLSQMIGDGRGAGDQALRELAELCGRLPLALRIAAMRFNGRPKWTVAHLTGRLRDGNDTLSHLRAGDQDLANTFRLSYERLPPGCQDVFRQLGRYPGMFTCASAAALAGMSPAGMDVILEQLVDEHLLEQLDIGSYRLHVLLRQFARSLAVSREPASLVKRE